MRQAGRCRTIGAAVVLCVLGLAGAAAAAPPEASATVNTLAIRATNEDRAYVDPALAPIAKELRRFPYNTFRLVGRGRAGVRQGETRQFALIEDYALRVQLKKASEESVDLLISVVRYEKDRKGKRRARVVLRAPVTIRKGKYILLGEFRLKEGALLAAVAAQ